MILEIQLLTKMSKIWFIGLNYSCFFLHYNWQTEYWITTDSELRVYEYELFEQLTSLNYPCDYTSE